MGPADIEPFIGAFHPRAHQPLNKRLKIINRALPKNKRVKTRMHFKKLTPPSPVRIVVVADAASR
eukprot:997843-Prorocentrum_lima.AAC.1